MKRTTKIFRKSRNLLRMQGSRTYCTAVSFTECPRQRDRDKEMMQAGKPVKVKDKGKGDFKGSKDGFKVHSERKERVQSMWE